MATFPLPTRPELSYKTGGRYFGAPRGARKHAACDLIAPRGTAIYAVANGTVRSGIYAFYHGTYAIEIDHGDFLVRYCEIESTVHGIVRGAAVNEGDLIAHVGKMYVDSMLHFEMYANTETGPLTNRGNPPYQRRADLMDPTDFLDEAVVRAAGPAPAR